MINRDKAVIEALLFVSDGPLVIEHIREVLGHLEAQAIRALIQELRQEYKEAGRGIHIVEIAGGFQMITDPELADYLKKYCRHKHKEHLSSPALEAMAIIAYRQPITRLEVEEIRGVNSGGVVKHLLDKRLIRIVGKKDAPGRPFIYGTTKQFLQYFGLGSLKELPKVEEFDNLANASQ
ncbi:MAG: SMC-Scp complex subunit ScpB [Candidatus Omnitrophota bacterium]